MAEKGEFKEINDMDEDAQKAFIEIVENIEERLETKSRILEDIKASFEYAKDQGHDVKVLRTLIARRAKMRKAGEDEVLHEENILSLYIEVCGDSQ